MITNETESRKKQAHGCPTSKKLSFTAHLNGSVPLHLRGTINLPTDEEYESNMNILKQEGSTTAKKDLIAMHVGMVDATPTATRQNYVKVGVEQMLVGLLCQVGATRLVGRAPKGYVAGQISKGKGRASRPRRRNKPRTIKKKTKLTNEIRLRYRLISRNRRRN